MNDKKNIDRFFQEQFKDFEQTPNEQVWINIEAELKKEKKERKVIPFWMKFSGIAAAFYFRFICLEHGFSITNTETKNSIVLDTENFKKSSKSKDSIQNKMKKRVTHWK